MIGGYHTHTRYCDGADDIASMVAAAARAGLAEIGISSHAPLPFATNWTMELESLPAYIAETRATRSDIPVLLGAELDYIPDDQVRAFQDAHIFPAGFNYFVGSVHFLGGGYPPLALDADKATFRRILVDSYQNRIEDMVRDYYARVREMVYLPGVRIVGHLDLIKRWNVGHTYFTGTEPWYVAAIEETLPSIRKAGVAVELNTAGWRKGLGEPYPAPWILRRCRELGIPIVVNSDAHEHAHIAWGFEAAETLLRELDIVPLQPPL